MNASFLVVGLALGLVGCTTDAPRERCHLFQPTSSEPAVSAWDVEASACTGHRILERVDEEGRVVELRFMDGDEPYGTSAWYPSVSQFAYTDTTIVETATMSDGSPFGLEVGAPFRTTYRVEGEYILGCRHEYAPGAFAEGEGPPDDKGSCPYIWSYLYSRAKWRGVDPTEPGFDRATIHVPHGWVSPPDA